MNNAAHFENLLARFAARSVNADAQSALQKLMQEFIGSGFDAVVGS